MTNRGQESGTVSIPVAAQRAGLSVYTVRRYVRVGLVEAPLREDQLAEVRRIRRLTEMGINLAGVEVILAMRRRIESLQGEIARLERLLQQAEEE
ncbi:MAG: MerR family transcriptional regulator [Anaerolineales bacterium]|mgnify:CR=1 FL=1|nr:MerR family transcriptional regulator [Anaerolineales bacterium]